MAKVRDPSMPLYVADWLSSEAVTAMSLEQQGAFMRLLCHAWLSGSCSLPDNETTLAALSTLGDRWAGENSAAIRSCLIKKRIGSETKLVNRKQYSVWKDRRKHAEKSREGGLKSGEARRSGTNQTRTKPRTKREPKGNLTSSSSFASSFASSRSILDAALARVRAETLSDPGLLLTWIGEAVAAGAFDGSKFTRDRVAALAYRCSRRGRNGGGGLFTAMMREGKFDHASDADFESAVAAIDEHERPPAAEPNHVAVDLAASLPKVPTDDPRPKNLEVIRHLAKGAR